MLRVLEVYAKIQEAINLRKKKNAGYKTKTAEDARKKSLEMR